MRQYGVAIRIYLDDNDSTFPHPFYWLYRDRSGPFSSAGTPDGPFWPYVKDKKIHLCPTFKIAAKQSGHYTSDYSYGLNGYLGWTDRGGVEKESQVERKAADVFVFSEENSWSIPDISRAVINDNCLLARHTPFTPDKYSDCFATYHNAPGGDLNKGTANAVFMDGHTQEVSALDPPGNTFLSAWPHKDYMEYATLDPDL